MEAMADLVLQALKSPSLKLPQVTQMKKKSQNVPQERWQWGMTTTQLKCGMALLCLALLRC